MKVVVHKDIDIVGEGSGEQVFVMLTRLVLEDGEVTLHIGDVQEYTVHVHTRGDKTMLGMTCVEAVKAA